MEFWIQIFRVGYIDFCCVIHPIFTKSIAFPNRSDSISQFTRQVIVDEIYVVCRAHTPLKCQHSTTHQHKPDGGTSREFPV